MKLKRKDLLERKTAKFKYYKTRKNGRKEKKRRMFSFGNCGFCSEENKHTVLLCQLTAKKYAAMVLLQSHLAL